MANMFTPSSTPTNIIFAQYPIAKPTKNSFININVKAGAEVGIAKAELY